MKKALWIILVLVVVGAGYGIYLWYKPHRNIQTESAEYTMPARELVLEYSSDEVAANKKYLDKVVQIRGSVNEVGEKHIKLESGIYCNGNFSGSDVTEGEEVLVKGRVVGYDELFEEVRMDFCTLENQ